jgi:hypothetical protein
MNTVNVLFMSIPPEIYVCRAENENIIIVSLIEVKMERQIKTLDLII